MTGSLPRVIFVNRVFWPSTEATAQLLTDLAGGLAARGWSVHVIATGTGPAEHQGVTIHRTGAGERHGGLLSRILNFRRFQRAARRQLAAITRPGDLLVPMTDPPLLAANLAPLAKTLGLRLIPWIQDIYPEIATVHFGAAAGILTGGLRRRRDQAWQQAVAAVTLGDDMARVVTAPDRLTHGLTIIPNWAPVELHHPPVPADVQTRRQAWGVADKFVIAYSGNLGRVHEFATVLDAAGRLRGAKDIVFLFIGRGPRFEEVAATVRSRGLTNVRLLPPEPRDRLGIALAAADAHLVTLRPEYASLVYPSKLAGVLAAGRPVLFVGPPDGDIGRLLLGRQCGAGFSPGDSTGLAATINRWRSGSPQTLALGQAARASYLDLFTFEAALTRWHELLLATARAT